MQLLQCFRSPSFWLSIILFWFISIFLVHFSFHVYYTLVHFKLIRRTEDLCIAFGWMFSWIRKLFLVVDVVFPMQHGSTAIEKRFAFCFLNEERIVCRFWSEIEFENASKTVIRIMIMQHEDFARHLTHTAFGNDEKSFIHTENKTG